jgi:thymidine kinase
MISLIIGPMFSGKTTELLRQLERAQVAKKRAILLRPKIDTRGFLSHSEKENKWLKQEFVDLATFDASSFEFIGIDEGQFFDGLKDFCLKCSLEGKRVVISALLSTSECQLFDPIVQILPYCDEIIKLTAVCTKCGSERGNYTYYLAGAKTEKVSVGGLNEYTALCDVCYFTSQAAQ